MRYINASEVGPFTYCKKQWELAGKKRSVTPCYDLPTSDPKLLGIQAHARHAKRVSDDQERRDTLKWITIIIVLCLAGVYAGTIIGPML